MSSRIPTYRNRSLLHHAKDRPCVLCGLNDGTTVAAHLPGMEYGMPAGTGFKTHDWLHAHLCFECHNLMNSVWRRDPQIRMKALCLTLERLFHEGILHYGREPKSGALC